jgi:hypothetical protein
MIIFVVIVHLSVTYSGIGSWYLTDTEGLDALSYVFFGLLLMFTQAYFMGLLFLISGYFTAGSYDKKGCSGFIKDRLIRLGIPTLIYMLIIHPFNVYVLLGNTWDKPQFINYYVHYIISLEFIGESGPLWFALALLIFDLIYTVIRIIFRGRNHSDKNTRQLSVNVFLLIIMILIASGTFVIRLFQPIDTNVLNMQLCNFSSYIILFIIGVKAGRYGWFNRINYLTCRRMLRFALLLGVVVWFVLMIAGGARDGDFVLYKGGFYWQSAAFALWETFIAVTMAVALIGIFREKYNKQSLIMKQLSDNCFSVYLFHAPIIIFLSIIIKHFQIHPVAKFMIAVIIGLPLCFLLSNYVFRRIPLLKKIL